MQSGRGVKRIPLARATRLPRLNTPAGYVVVIEDVDLGDRFKIVRLQEVNRRALARVTDLAFETELFLVLSAANAAALALELHDRFASSGDLNEWFDLDQAQVAQLREFGRPQAPSLRDLALSAVEGQSLVEKSSIVSAPPEGPPHRARVAQRRPHRRWAAWLLLLAIVTLGASVLGNAPQLRRLLSGRASIAEMLANRNVDASKTMEPSPSSGRSAAIFTPSPTEIADAGEVFYVRTRANARICASRLCRATAIVEAGTRIVALGYSSGQAVDGDRIWIKFRYERQNLFIHRSLLSRERLPVNASQRPSATSTLTAIPSATPMSTHTLATSDTATPTYTVEPTNTVEPVATAAAPNTQAPSATATFEPTATATLSYTATATDMPAVVYIDTANNLNARVRACPSTDCEILGRLRPGDEVSPTGEVEGEVVYGTAAWIAFEYDGRPGYVHGELVAKTP